METKLPLPTIKDLSALIREIKRRGIGDEYRADPEDDTPGVCLTVGWTNERRNQWGHESTPGDWSYQTGDNSYTGGAYGYPHWAIVSIYRRSDSRALARDIRHQLADLVMS